MSGHDVAIVGGGMTGAALALALARQDFSVALIDAGHPGSAPQKGPYDLRVSTFSPASRNLLQALGVWTAIAADRVQAFETMSVWDRDPDLALVFEAEDAGLAHLGYVAENGRVQGALWDALGSSPMVTRHTRARVDSLETDGRSARLRLAAGDTVRAALVVGADGANSMVREAAGIDLRTWDYAQKGVVCSVEVEAGHDRTAWQRFLPDGPLAFLPLANGQCSIVWSQSEAAADTCLEMDGDVFDAALGEAFQHRLGEVRHVSERAAFPLRRQRAQQYVGRRLALIGDAAHVIHPMAGQGVNLGFLDVASLVEVLVSIRDDGQDLGDPALLRRYERWRMSDNEVTAGALHALKAFYAVDVQPLARLRGAGAGLLNRSRFARGRLIEHASGFGGQVPKLVLGDVEGAGLAQ